MKTRSGKSTSRPAAKNGERESPIVPHYGDLPEGWTTASVLDLANLLRGVSYSKGEARTAPHPDHLPIVRANNINGQLVFDDLQYVPSERISGTQLLRRGDVVIAMSSGSKSVVGKAATVREDWKGGFGAFCGVLRPVHDIDSFFFGLFFRTRDYRDAISEASAGTNINNLKRAYFGAINIPIPPLAEQRRIVAKVEALLARVEAARQRLARVPAILKRFRQATLAAACDGRLTADCREVHAKVIEPIRSVAEKRHRLMWERREMSRIQSSGKRPKSDAWKQRYSLPISTNIPDRDLPEGWSWTPMGILGEDPLNTVQTGPFGAQLHRNEFVDSGVPVIAVGNLTGMGFTDNGLYFVTERKAKQLSRYDVQAGDVLFARSGATLGKVCVAPASVSDWRMTGHILRARLNTQFIHPHYVVYALHGDPDVVDQVTGNVRGVTRPGFNTSLLEVVLLPLPPLAEQHEIVRRVEALFKLADAIERRVAAASARADRLMQSILAKAFRGELVPTETELARREGRDYEPASVLLERIKSTAATNGRATPKPRRHQKASGGQK